MKRHSSVRAASAPLFVCTYHFHSSKHCTVVGPAATRRRGSNIAYILHRSARPRAVGGETRITFSPSCTIKVSPFRPPQQSEGNCLIFVSSDTSSRTWKADPNAWKQTVKIRKVGKGSDVESITSFCLGFYSPLCSAACRWPKLPAVLRSVRCLVSLPKKSSCPFTCQCVRPCLRVCVCACVSGEVEMKSPGCPLQSPATS